MTGIIKSVISKITNKENSLTDLIKKIADGDQPALSQLYRATSPNVYALANRMLKNKHNAEEITYDVFMQIWNTSHKYDSSKSSPLGWILMITRTRSIDRIRKESKSNYSEEIDKYELENPSKNPEKTALLSEEQTIVKTAISKLNNNERKMIELAYFHGFTQSEISDYLNQPLGTVKTTIRRSLTILKENLQRTIK